METEDRSRLVAREARIGDAADLARIIGGKPSETHDTSVSE